MKRIQNLKRTIALFLAMLMAATSTAFADWDSFQGNDDNNGTSTYGVTSTSPSTTTVPLPNNGATTGLDVEPLVYGSRIYAFHNGGSNGATVTAVSATNGSQLWTTVVGPKANNVSQVATPVITADGKTMYGVYTYGHDTKTTNFEDVTIPAGGKETRSFSFTLPYTYSNLQIATGLSNTEWKTNPSTSLSGNATIKKNGSTVATLSGSSYEDQGFSLYYGDYSGGPLQKGTYTVDVTITNNMTSDVLWTGAGAQALVNYWEMFQVTGIDGNNPQVKMLTAEPSSDPDNPSNNGYGQPASPLTLAGGYVYFGIYDGDVSYFQYNTDSEATSPLSKFTPGNNNSFYNAGAVVVGSNVIFGSESGTLYMRPVTNFSGGAGDTEILSNAGKIRSSICYDSTEGYIYLTSQNAILWRVKLTDSGFDSTKVNSVNIATGSASNSASTPVISSSGLIYASVYGYNKAFVGEGYIVAVSRSHFTDNDVHSVYSGDLVQCSPVVYSQDTTDYIYFTTNMPNGSGYCDKCQYASDSASLQWSVTPSSGGNGYAVQGFAMGMYTEEDEEGETVDVQFGAFGNDSSQLVIVK